MSVNLRIAGVAMFLAFAMVACGDDDTEELRAELDELSSLVAQQESTSTIAPTATATPTPDYRTPVCAAAKDWRDRVETFELTWNSAGLVSVEARAQVRDAFRVVALVSFPVALPDGSPEAALVELMRSWNSEAEDAGAKTTTLWELVEANAGTVGERLVTHNSAVEATLSANATLRRANDYLIQVCGLAPVDAYASTPPGAPAQ